MAGRLLDLVLACTALLAASPILAIAAIGIRLSSPGPILYKPTRVGRGAKAFLGDPHEDGGEKEVPFPA